MLFHGTDLFLISFLPSLIYLVCDTHTVVCCDVNNL